MKHLFLFSKILLHFHFYLQLLKSVLIFWCFFQIFNFFCITRVLINSLFKADTPSFEFSQARNEFLFCRHTLSFSISRKSFLHWKVYPLSYCGNYTLILQFQESIISAETSHGTLFINKAWNSITKILLVTNQDSATGLSIYPNDNKSRGKVILTL